MMSEASYDHLYGFSLLSSLLSYPASQHGTAKRSFPDSSAWIDSTLHIVSQGISAHYEFPRFWYFLIIAPNEMRHIRAHKYSIECTGKGNVGEA